jgi:multicomponent Na+:H+ antiporter subunit E
MRRVVMLVTLWLLAWGEVSLANVASGLAIAVVLLIAFPLSQPAEPRVRVRWIGAGRLVVYVLGQPAVSNITMSRQILRPPVNPSPCVLAHRLSRPSPEAITVMSSVIALSPGTMTVDVTADASSIYVHFFHLTDLDAGRRTLARLDHLVDKALAPDPIAPNLVHPEAP